MELSKKDRLRIKAAIAAAHSHPRLARLLGMIAEQVGVDEALQMFANAVAETEAIQRARRDLQPG